MPGARSNRPLLQSNSHENPVQGVNARVCTRWQAGARRSRAVAQQDILIRTAYQAIIKLDDPVI